MAENITNSNKDLDKFLASAFNIITGDLLPSFRKVTHLQADFYTCSSNTSRIASIDMSSSSATTYSDERLGLDLPSNQSAQVPAESPDISASRPSDKFKNNSFSAVKSMSIYADFDSSFDAIVRDRFSKTATSSVLSNFIRSLITSETPTPRCSASVFRQLNSFSFTRTLTTLSLAITKSVVLMWYNKTVRLKHPLPASTEQGTIGHTYHDYKPICVPFGDSRRRSQSFNFTLRSHADMESAVMQEETLYYQLTYDEWLKDIKELRPAEVSVLYLLRIRSPLNYRICEVPSIQIAKDLKINKSTVSRALKTLYQKGYIDRKPIEQDSPEKRVRDRLYLELGGLIEVVTPAGRIDLLTDNEIIEVKHISDWKSAMGQVLAYSGFYPEHSKRIHLFGFKRELPSSTAVTICSELGITLTYEEVE